MKIKQIKIDYTNGESETHKIASPGFLAINEHIIITQDYSLEDVYKTIGEFTGAMLAEAVDSFKTYRPLFTKLDETISSVKHGLSPNIWSKEFALKFRQGFLIDEVMMDQKLKPEDRKYQELYDQMEEFSKKAIANLKKKAKEDMAALN